MAQASVVPTLLCAQSTGVNNNSSTHSTHSNSGRLFAELTEFTSLIDVRVRCEAPCIDDVLSLMAGSAS
jgi:hypothetical protein